MGLLVVDDHHLFRSALVSLLRAHDADVIGEASDGREALALVEDLHPDVVLMDLTMPRMGGLEATRLIAAAHPEVKVVILTVSEAEEDLFEAIRSGAHGYLVKSTPADDFFMLLDSLERGHTPLSQGLALKIMRHLASEGEEPRTPPLSPREHEVLGLVAKGETNRCISDRLGVEESTIKFHMTNILRKLHLENRAQVVAYAHSHGVAPRDA
jgi:DNA-binding NarL/FixJ family response regulator